MSNSVESQPSYVREVADAELAALVEETAQRIDDARGRIALELEEWRDPVAWCRARGWSPLPWQERALRAVYRHRKVCIVGSNQIGKGNLTAWAMYHWLSRPVGIPRGMTTANTNDQVRENTWYEINKQHRLHGWDGECLVQRLKMPTGAQAVGYTTDEDQAMQGKHEELFLLVVDEGSGPRLDEQWDELKALPGDDGRTVFVGNRNRRAGVFAEACRGEMGFHVIRVTAVEVADDQRKNGRHAGAVTWEKIAEWIVDLKAARSVKGLEEWYQNSTEAGVRPPLSDKLVKAVRAFADDDGLWREVLSEEDQDWWRVHVLALEPKGALGGWFPTDLLEEARKRSPDAAGGVIRVGVDIAGQGEAGDWTDAYARDGYAVERIMHERSMDEETIADNLIEWAEGVAMDRSQAIGSEVKPTSLVHFAVDATGIGSGVATLLANRGYIVDRVHFGNPPKDIDLFANRVTEGYYHTAQFLRAGGQLPDIEDLQGDLEAIALNWRAGAQGRKVRAIVPKEKRKKVLKRSPDDGDAFMLCHIPSTDPEPSITTL